MTANRNFVRFAHSKSIVMDISNKLNLTYENLNIKRYSCTELTITTITSYNSHSEKSFSNFFQIGINMNVMIVYLLFMNLTEVRFGYSINMIAVILSF